jgi:hypothetical protein
MQDRIREKPDHAGQNKGKPEPCRTDEGKTRTMQDRLRENQNHAGQNKGETEPCRPE